MPSYQFSCGNCGNFDRAFPIADVPTAASCPFCAGSSRRRFGGTSLIHTRSAAAQLIDATRRTAAEPDVVGRRPARVTRNPLHRTLPRP